MDIGQAVKAMKQGKKIHRLSWSGKGMFLMLINQGDYSVKIPIKPYHIMALLPWIGMKTANNEFIPWLASQTDLLAEDWVIVSDLEPQDDHIRLDCLECTGVSTYNVLCQQCFVGKYIPCAINYQCDHCTKQGTSRCKGYAMKINGQK